jgi:uncharacterized metal-binding protein YceD (DUF177 family)
MNDFLRIYVDRLKDGHKEILHEEFPVSHLEVEDKDLKFKGPVSLKGEVYLVDQELVFHLSLKVKAVLLCSVCNQEVSTDINIKDSYQSVPVDEVKSAIYDMTELLREMILLEVPSFIECQGSCPQREEINKFLKKKEGDDPSNHNPFSSLKIEELPKD